MDTIILYLGTQPTMRVIAVSGKEYNITTGRIIQLFLKQTCFRTWFLKRSWYLNASLFLPFEELKYLDLSVNAICGWVPNEGLFIEFVFF